MSAVPVPRSWQSRAVEQCVSIAKSGSDRALIYACPGSGKTLGALFIAAALRDRVKYGPKILVLTPNLAVKSQWIERAEALGLKLLTITNTRQLLVDELNLEETGFVMNYQQVINNREALRIFCERHAPIVILDEVHHTEGPRGDREGNRWGIVVEHSCAPAKFKICTTGTPFREGNQPIAFVHYSEKGEATANVQYTYTDAIRDGVCRPIEFVLFDGDIEWRDGPQVVAANFQSKLTKRQQRQRLRAALSTDGKFPIRMLREAHETLSKIRMGSGVDAVAGGLVVTADTEHANQIADQLANISGERPMVVHSKIDDSIAEIERFRAGSSPWIVGVDMISEGVDIPRLRVGVYLSNVRAPLYFHQFCGRLARVMESPHERSCVYLPADPELEAIALEIEKERYHALGDEDAFRPRGGIGGGRPLKSRLRVEDSDGEAVATAIGGLRIPMELIREHQETIRQLRRDNPSWVKMSDAEIISMMMQLGVIKATVAA